MGIVGSLRNASRQRFFVSFSLGRHNIALGFLFRALSISLRFIIFKGIYLKFMGSFSTNSIQSSGVMHSTGASSMLSGQRHTDVATTSLDIYFSGIRDNIDSYHKLLHSGTGASSALCTSSLLKNFLGTHSIA